MFGRRKEIAELALARRLPSMHSFSDEVKDGGLMTSAPNSRRATSVPQCSRNSSHTT